VSPDLQEPDEASLIDSRHAILELQRSLGRCINRRLASRLPLAWHDPWKES
jgi:hypothetical protein